MFLFIKLKIKNLKFKKGVAAMVTILSFGTLIFIISLSTAAVTFWGVKNIDSNQKTLKAYYAAHSGMQEALLNLERNKDFNENFSLSVNSTNDVPVSVSNNGSQATISSTAVVGSICKNLTSIVDINPNTGLITVNSTTEQLCTPPSTTTTTSTTTITLPPPTAGTVIASNVSYSSFVDSPFDLSTSFTSGSTITSCIYTINGGIDWYLAVVSGSIPDFSCTKTDISSTDGSELTLNMRATNQGGSGTGTSISKTVDALAPTAADDWADNWTSTSPIIVTISPLDGSGSGVAATYYCVDAVDTCNPVTSGITASVTCADGSTCTQYSRYYTKDNVDNSSETYSKRVRQDKQVPTDGTLTATAGNTQVSLSWTAASDSGSGLATSDTYKLVYLTTGSPAANCTSGAQIYTGTNISYPHTGLTNGLTYYYRVCAKDAVSNISTGSTASAIPNALANGENCSIGGDCVSGYCYVDEDGDRYAPSSGTKKCQANSQIAGTDCCDADSRAYPGESTYYSSTNNCGSWDYDCSGTTNQLNCTYDTLVRSGQSCNCYWTSTCLAGTVTGYQTCVETGHTASCGTTNTHHNCSVGCRQRCPSNIDWSCQSPPCPGSGCSYSTYYYDSTSSRSCVCK